MENDVEARLAVLESKVAELTEKLRAEQGKSKALTLAMSQLARFWGLSGAGPLAIRLTTVYEEAIRSAKSQGSEKPLHESFEKTARQICEALYRATQDRRQ